MVRTSGFHPGNRGSIPRSHAIKKMISRVVLEDFLLFSGVEKWYLVGLITRRSQVQFLSPQPN